MCPLTWAASCLKGAGTSGALSASESRRAEERLLSAIRLCDSKEPLDTMRLDEAFLDGFDTFWHTMRILSAGSFATEGFANGPSSTATTAAPLLPPRHSKRPPTPATASSSLSRAAFWASFQSEARGRWAKGGGETPGGWS